MKIPEHESNCGWSGTQQQHSTDNTKRTKILDVKTCRIFAINIRKRGMIHIKKRRNCGWSDTRQQHSKRETKRTVNIYDVKTYKKNEKTDPSNFRKYTRKWGVISRRHCGWSGASTTTQKYETGEKTVLKCLFKWARHWVDSLVLRWAACFIKKRRDYQL